jgi:hypothetical protein
MLTVLGSRRADCPQNDDKIRAAARARRATAGENMRRSIATLGAALTLAMAVSADEIRLKDGRVLIGKAKVDGDVVRVVTADGTERFALADVQRIRTDRELLAELDALAERAGRKPHAHLGIAVQARRWGLEERMWEHLDIAVEESAVQGAVRRRLDAFLAELEGEILPARLLDADPEVKVKELLYRVRRGQPASKIAAIEAILARLDGPDALLHLERRARQAGNEAQRLVALRAIQRRPEMGSRYFVYRTAILDRSADVRAKSMSMVAEAGGSREAVDYLAPGLVHGSPYVRMRTAEAYANLGDVNAAPLLVAAGPLAANVADPGGSVRANIAVLEQQAYVRDFDVEVAQAAFIADPKIDVLQSGVVLDATVHSVVTIRREIVDSYRRTLRSLVGADPGSRTKKWAEWYAGLGDQLPPLPGQGTKVANPTSAGTSGDGASGLKNPGTTGAGARATCPTPVPTGTPYLPGTLRPNTPIPGLTPPQPAVPKVLRVPTPTRSSPPAARPPAARPPAVVTGRGGRR